MRRLLRRSDNDRTRSAADSAGRADDADDEQDFLNCLVTSPSYSAARRLRGGSGTVYASARRALPLKRRSG